MFGAITKRAIKMASLTVLLLFVVLHAGCVGQSESTKEKGSYGDDGYMGLTNAHPGLGAAKQSHNYARDVDVMRGAVADMPELRNMRVFIDGGNASVHLYVDTAGQSESELRELTERAKRKLRAAAPRYDVKVRVHAAG